jgi:apolipoprotein N-acyltransferase
MFWVAEACVRVVMFREWRPTFLLPAVALAISVGYGAVMMRTLGAPGGEMQEIVLVQGPPSLSEKRDIDSIWHNGARLYELSRSAARKGSLIIWPEGAVPAYLPAELTSARNEPCLPWLHDGSAFLVGSFAVDAANRRYNTAFAIYADGSVPPPYFKRTLIPFGEYMPFSSVVPWLNKLNDKAGLFSPGHEIQVYSYAMERPDGRKYTARAAPLICYEDTITGPAREATLRGAEVLINLTYDTWFGRSAAPYQHHLIAIFRAIENRRFLVRSTYTGYTAVVSPLGKTIAHIPPFAEGTLALDVALLKYQSSYTNYIGERPWWALVAVTAVSVILSRRSMSRPRPSQSG